MSNETREVKRRRGIYLLPNLFTTAALFAGFYAIVAAKHAQFEAAAVAIFIAMILDGLDGRIARLTNTQSDFGVQYDSLSDMIAFGLAPALVIYEWSLYDAGKLGWLAAFIYTVAAGLRLARFNTQAATADKGYFQGLASPAAAALIAGLVWVGARYEIDGTDFVVLSSLLTILAGVLMVSNIRYRSFKDLDLRGKVPFFTVLVIVLIFVFISLEPPVVLFSLAMAYALSGPALTLWYLHRRRRSRTEAKTPQGGGGPKDAGPGT
jgi:CDP-diacylglycerol---serine O-phosphatidyltransferase